MPYIGRPTLDQLRVFLTVVDTGSFAGAARKLSRATSVVSYTMTNLEGQLGVSLFDRESTRKPQLTAAGRTVLAEARSIASSIDGLQAKVKSLHLGVEPEVRLVLDVMLPAERVLEALQAFRAEFPFVSLHLRVEALGAVMQVLLDRAAVIGVCGPPDTTVDGIDRIDIGSVELLPVAAPNHPLAIATENVSGAARDHVQLVLTDRSTRTMGHELGVHGVRTWRVTDLASKHMLLVEGVGWGHMPEPLVRNDLKAGRLVRLNLPDNKGGAYRFFAIHRTDTPPGPAASYLISRFANQAPSLQGIS